MKEEAVQRWRVGFNVRESGGDWRRVEAVVPFRPTSIEAIIELWKIGYLHETDAVEPKE